MIVYQVAKLLMYRSDEITESNSLINEEPPTKCVGLGLSLLILLIIAVACSLGIGGVYLMCPGSTWEGCLCSQYAYKSDGI